MEYGEMGGVPAPYIVDRNEPTRSALRWNDLDESALSEFEVTTSNDPPQAAVAPGEGFVDGWFATDVSETIDLPSDSSDDAGLYTIVAGWDPDAVYSDDLHAAREEADSVVRDLEQNLGEETPYVRLARVRVEDDLVTATLVEDLRPIIRPFTYESGELVPTSSIATGPLELPANATRGVYSEAPIDDQATVSDRSLLTLLKSGTIPAVFLERILDGGGGAYGHALEAPLGRFSRTNALLSWEYETLADVGNWTSKDGGNSVWTYDLVGRPRRLHVEHDGSGGADDYGGFVASVLATYESLGGFRITFKNVSFTANAPEDNGFRLGFSSIADASVSPEKNGDGLYFREDGAGEYTLARTIDRNATFSSGSVAINWSETHDITIEYEGSEGVLLVDGSLEQSISFDQNNDYRPIVQLNQEADIAAAETIEVGQVIVEPLPEVLN